MTQFYQIINNYPVVSPISLEGFTEYEVGAEPQELKDAFIVQQALEDIQVAKQARELALSQITVTTTSGKVFDGREKDIPLMSGAIEVSVILGVTSTQWKLHDNTVVTITLDELKEALALSMQAIGAIKVS